MVELPMLRCAVLDDYQGVALKAADWSRLDGRVETIAFSDRRAPDELAARLADFEIIIAMRERTPFDRALLERLPRLKLLVTTGARNAAIDLAAARDRDVVVCGTRSAQTPTSELTFALLLALARNLIPETRSLRSGGWQTSVGTDLAGARLGVLGLGKIGLQVAAFAKAFEMDVAAWSPNLTQARCDEAGVAFARGLDDLLIAADFLTIHIVLSQATRGLIGRRELALMKPTARLINTSRGPIVEEAALIEALKQRRIAGAALDVFDIEPLPSDHPFRHLDNVLATPHLGYVSERNYAVFYSDAVADIAAWLDGSPIRVIELRA
jgi:phosphoglycerate dehydrogenase-like enzyme